VAAGEWVEPEAIVRRDEPPIATPSLSPRFAQRWNDFLAEWAPQSTLAESTMAELIAWVGAAVPDELGDLAVRASVEGPLVEVTTARGDLRDEFLVAVCDLSSRGGALQRRIEECPTIR
jgi:hypothetical protein